MLLQIRVGVLKDTGHFPSLCTSSRNLVDGWKKLSLVFEPNWEPAREWQLEDKEGGVRHPNTVLYNKLADPLGKFDLLSRHRYVCSWSSLQRGMVAERRTRPRIFIFKQRCGAGDHLQFCTSPKNTVVENRYPLGSENIDGEIFDYWRVVTSTNSLFHEDGEIALPINWMTLNENL